MKNSRVNKILEGMAKEGLSQMIITSPASIFYLTGKWIHPGERMIALYINKNGNHKMVINRLFPVYEDLGVDNGSRLRVAGEGEAGVKGGPSGDLYVYLYVKPHKFFERDGTTVYCEVPINIVQATLGDEIKVPTLDGQVVMKVPEGTQPGKVLRLKGKGIPSLRNSTRGDQLVRIKVVVPQKLNEKQKDALRKFAEISKDNINPEEKGFLNKIKDLFK